MAHIHNEPVAIGVCQEVPSNAIKGILMALQNPELAIKKHRPHMPLYTAHRPRRLSFLCYCHESNKRIRLLFARVNMTHRMVIAIHGLSQMNRYHIQPPWCSASCGTADHVSSLDIEVVSTKRGFEAQGCPETPLSGRY